MYKPLLLGSWEATLVVNLLLLGSWEATLVGITLLMSLGGYPGGYNPITVPRRLPWWVYALIMSLGGYPGGYIPSICLPGYGGRCTYPCICLPGTLCR